jgi:hypothetical protein
MKRANKVFFFLAALSLCCAALWADFFSDEAGSFAFDLPEGFTLTGKSDNAWAFQSAVVPVEFVVRAYQNGEYATPQEALEALTIKLNAEGEATQFLWRGQTCLIARISMRIQADSESQSGWALIVPLPETNGIITALAFSSEKITPRLQQFMFSALDSLYIDDESWFVPGPITEFAYSQNAYKNILVAIGGLHITSSIGVEDKEAAAFVIEREFGVLSLYAQNEFMMSAWQRYYRLIYRDSYGRLNAAARDIFLALRQKHSDSPELREQPFEQFFLRALLKWTQEFIYERDFSTSDFSPLPAMLEGGGSDCDSRAMLLCVILNATGHDAMLFFSPEYRHALLGVAIEMPGAAITVDSREYLLGETTARAEPGVIAKEISLGAQWYAVKFPR